MDTATPRAPARIVLVLLGTALASSLISAALFLVVIVIQFQHLAVDYALQQALFVSATALGIAAEALEIALLLPLLRRARTRIERVGLVAALIPVLNLLVLGLAPIGYVVWRTANLLGEVKRCAFDALRNAPQQVAQAPTQPQMPVAPTLSPAAPDAVGVTSAEVAGAGTPIASPATQMRLPHFMRTLLPTAAPALLQSPRRLIPVALTTLVIASVATAVVGGSGIANAALGGSVTPTSPPVVVAPRSTATLSVDATDTPSPAVTTTANPRPTSTSAPATSPTLTPTFTPTPIPPPPALLTVTLGEIGPEPLPPACAVGLWPKGVRGLYPLLYRLYTLSNAGGQPLNWSVTISDPHGWIGQSWDTPSPQSGALLPGSSFTFWGQTDGYFDQGTFTVTSNGGNFSDCWMNTTGG